MRPTVDHLSADSRRWRTGLLLGCALALVACLNSILVCSPLLPACGTAGFDADFHPATDSIEITGIAEGGPAAQASLRVADRIDFRSIAFLERWRLRAIRFGWPVPVGEPLRFIVDRGTQRFTAVVIPQPVPPSWGTWKDWVSDAIGLWGLLFAALLAVRRPDLVKARLLSLLLILIFGLFNLTATVVPWAIADFIIVASANLIVHPGLPLLVAIISTQFARPLSTFRRRLTAAVVVISALTIGFGLVIYLKWYVLAVPTSQFTTNFSLNYLLGLAYALAPISAIAAAIASRGPERQQAAWIAVAIAPYFVVLAIAASFGYGSQKVLNALSDVGSIASLTVPVGLTYAVLSRRSVDLGYVVNRAAVFAAMSALVLAVFVVVEWGLSTMVSNASHTTSLVVNIGVALILGLSLRFIHRRVDYVIDRIFFRKRYENEVALRRFTREAAFITDERTLLDRTEKMLMQHGEASAVSVLLKRGGRGYAASGNGVPARIDENDPAIVAMRTWHEPLDLARYETTLDGTFAFPMIARGSLIGVLVLAGKQNGEAFAPDESETIAQLAQGVGVAIDILDNKHGNSEAIILDAIRSSNGSVLEAIQMLTIAMKNQDSPRRSTDR